MFKVCFVFALVAAEVQCKPADFDTSGFILNGKQTSISVVPYQASLRYKRAHICGASIISETFLISAAHCKF